MEKYKLFGLFAITYFDYRGVNYALDSLFIFLYDHPFSHFLFDRGQANLTALLFAVAYVALSYFRTKKKAEPLTQVQSTKV